MMMTSKWRALRTTTALACCFFTAACSLDFTPHEKLEAVQIEGWNSLGAEGTTGGVEAAADAVNPHWWTTLNDTMLDELVTRALQNSHALAIAETKVKEAEADAGLARANRMPQIDGVGSAKRLRDSDNPNGTDTQSSIGIQALWDLDPAGVNRHRNRAALLALSAAEAARDKIRIDTIAEVAIAYIRLRGAQAQLHYAQLSLSAQKNTLSITRGQREQGVVDDFEVNRSQAQMEVTQSRLPSFETAITTSINRLNVLCGDVPGTLDSELKGTEAIPTLPAKVVIAMPLAVLTQRPDIQEAAFRFSQNAEMTESTALEIFPTLSLSAFLGWEDSERVGSINPWNIAAGTIAPLLNFGRIQSRVDAASAREDRAFHEYHLTVITAVAEVEDALAAYANEQNRMNTLKKAVASQTHAFEIVSEQFKAGEAEHSGLLQSQKDQLEARLALAGSKAQAAENLIRLYQAMGWGAQAQTTDVAKIQSEVMPAEGVGMKPVVDQ